MLGVPVIACNVGGVSSIVEHMVTGILIPSNGIFELTSWIIEILKDNNLKTKLSTTSKLEAKKRHDKEKIVTELVKVYQIIKSTSI
jgi:glycosyltransferase involved in cell wall biosynthesis